MAYRGVANPKYEFTWANFEKIENLGNGSFGIVYKAFHKGKLLPKSHPFLSINDERVVVVVVGLT